MIDGGTLRQIARAAERHGGNLEDVRDLVRCWERMHDRLDAANTAHAAGNTEQAEIDWAKLEAEFAKPIDDIVREHMRGSQERAS